MELMALDENYNQLCYLTYYDLMWDRKYYEPGEFTIQILASDYNEDMAYIYTKDRPETGIIQHMEYTDDDNMVVLKGYFAEKLLGDKIVYPVFNGSGNIPTVVRNIITTYKSDIHNLQLGTFSNEGASISKQETGGNLDDVVFDMLQIEEKSCRMRYDYQNDRFYFDIWKGIDRTQSQAINNFVVFSNGFRNIKKVSAEDDDSKYKNYFVVGGSGEGPDRVYEIVDLSGGGYKRMQFIDAKSTSYDSDKQTLAEYKAELHQKGIEKASKYVDIHNVEFDAVNDSGFVYLQDYDLGDRCDIAIEAINKAYEARIIEICEVFKANKHTVTLTFGDKIPTIYERAMVK